MIAELELQAPVIPPRRTPNLILHCGAHHVDLQEVRQFIRNQHPRP